MISRHINPEVANALQNNIPVVALESTIITHGMPYPENLKMVLEVEEIIRDNHAVPATIAVVDGVVKIGLSKDEVRSLSEKKDVIKVLSQLNINPNSSEGPLMIEIMNKIDKAPANLKENLYNVRDLVFISALTGEGIDVLKNKIDQTLLVNMKFS